MKRRTILTGFGGFLLLILVMTIYFFNSFQTVVVSGESMMPTLKSGTRLLVSNAYWLVGPIRDNDIVVIRGTTKGEYIIKRVFKMGGESVDWYNAPKSWTLEEDKIKDGYTVPEGSIYVIGDNRPVSEDSRYFGPVELGRVLGKVVVRPAPK